jgi:hypothetical protein
VALAWILQQSLVTAPIIDGEARQCAVDGAYSHKSNSVCQGVTVLCAGKVRIILSLTVHDPVNGQLFS